MRKKYANRSILNNILFSTKTDKVYNPFKTENNGSNKDLEDNLLYYFDTETEKTKKNKHIDILANSTKNISLNSLINRQIRVSTHKTPKMNSSHQNKKMLTEKNQNLNNIPKVVQNYQDKIIKNLYNDIQQIKTYRNPAMKINKICYTNPRSYKHKLYDAIDNEKNSEYSTIDIKYNDDLYKTHSNISKSIDIIDTKNNFMKILSESFNIISKSNNKNENINNEKNKLLQKIEQLENKIKELTIEKEKINDINNIIIRDSKQLELKLKNFHEKFNNLYVQKQFDILYERFNNNNKIIDINKSKLFFILQKKFDNKIFKNKLLLCKYFQKLYLYSKLNDIRNIKQNNFIISNSDNFIIKKKATRSYSNNDIDPRNILLTSIINKKNLERYIFVNNFEKWKFKSKILKTINFVREKKRKKRERSKQKKQKKLGENNDENYLSNQKKNSNNINCYEKDKEEDDLWNEYGSEYSDEEEKDENNKTNSIKSKSYKKDNNDRKNKYVNYYRY